MERKIYKKIIKKMKLDWKDISIVPSEISDIESRTTIDNKYDNNKLPIFTAPMDKVLNLSNSKIFDSKVNVCLPRGLKNDEYFQSFSLEEVTLLFNHKMLPKKVLIDVANGNMKSLIDISKKIKEKLGSEIELMVGNIGNPETFREWCKIGVDYIRCGIGGGSACLTAQNVGVFYPMASLIIECRSIANEFENPPKIIADGGFKEYSEIIKALACGADYVMIGGIFSKCVESCGETYIKSGDEFIEISKGEALSFFKEGGEVYKKYRGMSTKEVQKDWNRKRLVTSEGIVTYNKVEYFFEKWIENFDDYLRSAMSYTNSHNLSEFIGKVNIIEISENSYKRFEK